MRIVSLFALVSLLAFVTVAYADLPPTTNILDMEAMQALKDAAPHGTPTGERGLPGDVVATALPIPSLPFGDTGNTCNFNNDYDAVCPYTGSTSPDVVYSFTPATDMRVTIDLCASLYDTKVYVLDASLAVIACNDDACGDDGWKSLIQALALTGGQTYYIVVDGYGTDCGDYDLSVTVWTPPCEIPCPPGALVEDEPPCFDYQNDVWNGGCNSEPYVFEKIAPACGTGQITLCGTAGTDDAGYRDTDWYEIEIEETSTITFCCVAQFPVQIFIVDGNLGCADPPILYSNYAEPCTTACISGVVLPPGTYWLWVGTSVFAGWPCGLDYVMTIDGYYTGEPSATEETTWGTIKSSYR